MANKDLKSQFENLICGMYYDNDICTVEILKEDLINFLKSNFNLQNLKIV